jgi:hypothetical protein
MGNHVSFMTKSVVQDLQLKQLLERDCGQATVFDRAQKMARPDKWI